MMTVVGLLWVAFFIFVGPSPVQASIAVDDAVNQVSSTLDNLLASLEQEGKTSEEVEAPREAWCQDQLQAARTRVADLGDESQQATSDVAEVEAAADEIQAASKKLRSDLNTTKGVQRASLENQLSAELPLLASKRSSATELNRRELDLKHVLQAETDALADLEAECTKRKENAQADAKTRMNAAVLLEKTKQLVANVHQPATFVQVAELQQRSNVASRGVAARGQKKLAALRAAPAADPLAGARDHLVSLTKALTAPVGKDEKEACNSEIKSNELAQAWKEDELSRLKAEMKSHSEAADQSQEDLDGVEAASAGLEKRKAELEKQSKEDTDGEQKRARDQVLLSKVVTQAITVLKAGGPDLSDAASSMQEVEKVLSQNGLEDIQSASARAQRSAARAIDSLASEKAHITLARSQHQVSLADMRDASTRTEQELTQIKDYLATLRESCDGKAEAGRRAKEAETLAGAVRKLDSVVGGDAGQSLPLPEIDSAKAATMTPLQRAAMEMGVQA